MSMARVEKHVPICLDSHNALSCFQRQQIPNIHHGLNIRDVSEIQLYCPYRVSHIIHSAIILIVFAIVSGQGWAHGQLGSLILSVSSINGWTGISKKWHANEEPPNSSKKSKIGAGMITAYNCPPPTHRRSNETKRA